MGVTPEEAKKLVGLVVHIAAQYHPPNSDQMDELISAGLVGAGRAAQTHDPAKGANLATWATCCIRGHIKDALRKAGKHPQPLSIDQHEEEYGPTLDPAAPKQEEAGDVTRYFCCLSEQQRTIFELHYLHNLTFTEISKRLHRCKAAIHYQHARGLRRIRERIQGRGLDSFGRNAASLR